MDDFLNSNDSEKYLLTWSKQLSEMLPNCSFCFTSGSVTATLLCHPSPKLSYLQNLIVSMKALSKEFYEFYGTLTLTH